MKSISHWVLLSYEKQRKCDVWGRIIHNIQTESGRGVYKGYPNINRCIIVPSHVASSTIDIVWQRITQNIGSQVCYIFNSSMYVFLSLFLFLMITIIIETVPFRYPTNIEYNLFALFFNLIISILLNI